MNTHLILASQSIGRKMLLETLNIPFTIIPSTIDEDKIITGDPVETIRLRAQRKAEDVTAKIQNLLSRHPERTPIKSGEVEGSHGILRSAQNDNLHKSQQLLREKGDLIVLSADSGAILDGKIYGKPKDLEHARVMLGTLAGRVQTFITATYIISLTKDIKNHINSTQVVMNDTDTNYVTFKDMTSEEIDLYLSLTDYKKYAGSYALYTSPQFFITKIEGSLSSVVGLPLEKVIPVFKKFGLFPSFS
jgi:septum formation protein